jgi:hypothetical protein
MVVQWRNGGGMGRVMYWTYVISHLQPDRREKREEEEDFVTNIFAGKYVKLSPFRDRA